MTTRLRSVTFLALTVLALVVYQARLRHEMIDFVTWRQAAVRALQAEPLYRAGRRPLPVQVLSAVRAGHGAVRHDRSRDRKVALVRHPGRAARGHAPLVDHGPARQAPVAAGAHVDRHRADGEVLRARTAARTGQPAAWRAAAGGAGRRPERSTRRCRCLRRPGRLRQAVCLDPGALAARHPGMARRRHDRRRCRCGLADAGCGLRLDRQPGPAARMAPHRQRLDAAQPAEQRQRVDCLDVGQVAGSRFTGLRPRVADRGSER